MGGKRKIQWVLIGEFDSKVGEESGAEVGGKSITLNAPCHSRATVQ